MIQHTLFGWGAPDLAALFLRLTLGIFFLLARFRWVYDPSLPIFIKVSHLGSYKPECAQAVDRWFPEPRHESLRNKLIHCGYGATSVWMAWVVAAVELSAALGVIFGLFTSLAALGLAGVLLFATICTAKEKVARQNPIDCLDCVSCYLWLVEPLYFMMAVVLVLTGGGLFSLDGVLLQWMR